MKGSGGGGGGEIVQVQGGHIVRATSRKDRHSKVYTSKGPRDRRVRLSAHTAIQFYDVQDRLGFDRPSKAVDWLIRKAKSSIDKLADLPPWHPNSTSTAGPTAAATSSSGEMPLAEQPELAGGYAGAGSSSFMPPPPQLDDSDTMKLFFPTSNAEPSQSISFTGYSVPHEMVARAPQQSEDLGLSLHSFQDSSGGLQSSSSRALFVGTGADAFEPGCSHYPRMMGWGGDAGTEEGRGGSSQGFFMNQGGGSALMMVNPQRGPLQSSFTGGFDELPIAIPSDNHHQKPPVVAVHQPPFFGGRLGSDSLSGFYFPTRVHGSSGNEEPSGIVSGRPSSSASPSSSHR
ncbi:hypothetical protein CDL15_Pgr001481 [Punica granatum]|nr:hypothetical protein CDL15_Pgr001481 [Punica granatum]